MNTRNGLHETVVVATSYAKLFKRLLAQDVVLNERVVNAELEQLRHEVSIFLKFGKGEDAARTLLRRDSARLLEAAFEVELAERCLTLKKPIAINSAGDVAATTSEADRIWRSFVVGTGFPGVVKDNNRLVGKDWLHGVEHLFHARGVILVFLVQFSKDVDDYKVGRFRSDQSLYKRLPSWSSDKKWQHHIVLVDKPKIGYIEVEANLFELTQSLSPSGFFGVKLKIEDFLGSGATVTHDGLTGGDTGSYVEGQERLTDLGWPQEQHVARFWYESGNQPFQLGSWGTQVLLRGDGTDHV